MPHSNPMHDQCDERMLASVIAELQAMGCV